LRTGPEATAVPEPGPTAGGWVDFAQQTEGGRLQENRDKRTVDSIYQVCHRENVRINAPPRRKRFLGLI
jgi:hypothetical protein